MISLGGEPLTTAHLRTEAELPAGGLCAFIARPGAEAGDEEEALGGGASDLRG